MTLFIAEDEPGLQALLFDLLGEIPGIEIVGQTDDATKAKELIASLRPDVVVLDLTLHGGSGWDVLKHVKTTMPLVIVIVISGKDDPSIEPMCQNLGADYFFRKSEGFDQLVQVVNRLKPQRIPPKKHMAG